MAIYRDIVVPRILDVVMNTTETRRIRSAVCAPLSGDVVEIGFGTGLNLPHLPPAVTRLRAVDPMERGRTLAAKRTASSVVPVEFVGSDGQELTLEDETADAVLATWTLCSIPDPVAAVREIARVLRPGRAFHFVEHGRAPDPKVQRWQDRLNGIENRVACGCNLNREIPRLIEEGGLTIETLDTYYLKGAPKIFGWTFQGVARR